MKLFKTYIEFSFSSVTFIVIN